MQYADPLLDQLDKQGTIRHRLFRESCTYYQVRPPPFPFPKVEEQQATWDAVCTQ